MRREPGGKVFGGGDQHVPAGRKEAEKKLNVHFCLSNETGDNQLRMDPTWSSLIRSNQALSAPSPYSPWVIKYVFRLSDQNNPN